MLVIWRFKVQKLFAIQGDSIVVGKHLNTYRGGKAKPRKMYIYKPSRYRYDYVDYTGRVSRTEVDAHDLTCELEFLGYIKFVESSNERET